MATFNGREANITVNSLTGEAVVAEMSDWSINRKAAEIDTAAFGDGWSKSDVGMLSYSGSFKGSFDPTDTTGQGVLKTAFEDGSLINDIRFYIEHSDDTDATMRCLAPDIGSTNGIRVTSMDVSIDKNGVGQLSVSFSGSGAIKENIVERIDESGAVTSGVHVVELTGTASIAATIADAANHAGSFVVVCTAEPATTHTVTLTSGTWDGTNDTATFSDIGDALLVTFDASGDGTIVSNVGSVALS